MGHAYMQLLENREEIMFQHQANAAAGDPALREPVRERVHAAHGRHAAV